MSSRPQLARWWAAAPDSLINIFGSHHTATLEGSTSHLLISAAFHGNIPHVEQWQMPMETLNTLQFPILGPDILAYLFCHLFYLWI
jgi:hypothetical protein